MILGVRLAAVACAAVLLMACGGSTTPGTTGSTNQKLADECKPIRSQYPDVPKQITVAVSPFNAQIEETDPNDPSKIIGIEPDMINAIATCLGFTYTYNSEAFAAVIASLTSGNAQLGITGLFITDSRIKVIDMVSHMASVDVLFTTPALNSQLKTPLDLCGHKLGQTVGTAEADYVQKVSAQCKAAGKPAIDLSQFPDLATLPLNIANGRIEASVNSDLLVSQMTGGQYQGKIVQGFPVPELTYPIGIGISKLTESKQLPQAVQAAVKQIQDDGTAASILQKWGFPASSVVPSKLSGI